MTRKVNIMSPAAYSHPLRVVLVILGIYSGKHKHRALTFLSSFYHGMTCSLNTALVIAGKDDFELSTQ